MKKELFAVTALAAGMLLADTTPTVTTSNMLGFLPVPDTVAKASDMYLVTVPFRAYGATTEQSINVAEVLQTANLAVGDELFIPAGEGKYNNYKLNASKVWEPAKVVTLNADGSVKTDSGVAAAEATVARGTAFWVKTSATQVNLLGEGVTAAKGVTVTGGESAFQWNLIGATTCTGSLNLGTLVGSAGDVIRLANGTQYRYNASPSKAGWYKLPVKSGSVKTSDVIPAGVGIWYATKATQEFTTL